MPSTRAAAASAKKAEVRPNEGNLDFIEDEGNARTTRKSKRAKKERAEKVVPVDVKADESAAESQFPSEKRERQTDEDVKSQETLDFVEDRGKANNSRKTKREKKEEQGKVTLVSEKEEESTSESKSPLGKHRSQTEDNDKSEARFIGLPVPAEEAKLRWPERYQVQVYISGVCILLGSPVMYGLLFMIVFVKTKI